jgi:hypothetical protein
MAEKELPQPQRTDRFRDARGRQVSLLDPYSLNLLWRYDVIEAEPLREIAEEVGPGVSRWGRRAYWIGFAVGLYSVGSAVVTRTGNSTSLRFIGIGDAIILSFFIILFGGLYLYLRSARRARSKRVCGVMLKHLRCPHCGYDLRLLPTAPEDRATVCPECGCAWRLDDARAVGVYGSVVSDPPCTTGARNAGDDGNG